VFEVFNAVVNKRLEAFSRSLERKSESKFKGMYPVTFKLVPADVMQKLFRRYYALFPARPFGSRRRESDDFGQFMIDTIDGLEGFSPYAKDIVRYELARNRVKYSTSAEDDFAHINQQPTNAAQVADGEAARYRLADGVTLETFDYDVLAIADALSADRRPSEADLRPNRVRLVFQAAANSPEPKIFRVNEPTWNVLSKCDGGSSLQEIGGGLVSSLQGGTPSDWSAQLSKLVQYLLERSLVRYSPLTQS
jgi:hypothetical protein